MSENISKQIRSEVTKERKLLLYIESTEIPEPKEDEVLISCLLYTSPSPRDS